MNFGFGHKSKLRFVALLSGVLVAVVSAFWLVGGGRMTTIDFQALDAYYRLAARSGHTPPSSGQIVYLGITDHTYRQIGKHVLDRSVLARVNAVLAEFGPEAVAYDLIFARPSTPAADREFAESLRALEHVHLPIAFSLSDHPRPFVWEAGAAYERLRSDDLKRPLETGRAAPFYAETALPQADQFSAAAGYSGFVNTPADPDGVYRHYPLLIKVDEQYMPSLSLAMFLRFAGVALDDVTVAWGRHLRIPAAATPFLADDIMAPIDERGRTFIPFTHAWGEDYPLMDVHDLLEYAGDPSLRGNLLDFFEGKFVLIGDVSQGAADIGQTPLEGQVPLIAIHAAMLNGLLTNTLYRSWPPLCVLLLIWGLTVVLALAALPRSTWVLYVVGGLLLVGLLGLTWWQFLRFNLFPLVSVSGSMAGILAGFGIGLHLRASEAQTFIRQAFARYVPEAVVEELLNHPERLALGGETREITVLFSDLEGFTTISECLSPEQLVRVLNRYLTEMTAIILAEGGIIDKYEGDAIMAEFGAPLPLADHADRAVSAALSMQARLAELRQAWAAQGLPQLRCRIGIHTGLAVVGNMGSEQVFDYTALGDNVNLASRLEGANKLYHTAVMISEATLRALTPQRFQCRVLDMIKVKGKSQPVNVFEVYGRDGDVTAAHDERYYRAYQRAFEAYLAQDFERARDEFTDALALRPNDPAATWLLARIAALLSDGAPQDWDGSIVLTSK
jgi:adenylate cyclase